MPVTFLEDIPFPEELEYLAERLLPLKAAALNASCFFEDIPCLEDMEYQAKLLQQKGKAAYMEPCLCLIGFIRT